MTSERFARWLDALEYSPTVHDEMTSRYAEFEEVPDWIEVLDRYGGCLYTNISGRRLLGMAEVAPPAGSRWVDIWPETARERAEAAFATAAAGRIGRFEDVLPAPDGSERSWEVILVPVQRADATPDRVLCIARDVTADRFRASFGASGAFDRVLADALPQIVWISSVSGGLEYANRQWVEYTGLSLEESMGSGWIAAVHPDDRTRLQASWDRAAERGVTEQHEMRLCRARDRVYRWHVVDAQPMRDASGRVERYVGTTTDIHDQKWTTDALRFLVVADESVNLSLDVATTLRAVSEAAIPTLADWCAIYLPGEGGRLACVAVAHANRSKVDAVEAVYRRQGIDPEDSVSKVYATGESLLFATIESPEPGTRGADLIEISQLRSAMVVPLVEGSRVFGVVSFAAAESGRNFNERDLAISQLFARRAASAIDRAQLFEREHRIATVLQDAFLPKVLPTVSGVQFDAVYVAARAEALVGGDWYDAFSLPDGRIGITLGDVSGSGLRAAVTMGKLRQAMQSVAMLQPYPSAMLDAADLTLRAAEPDGIVTAIAGVFDPGTASLTYASAGHPSPLLSRPDGGFSEFVGAGLPLGLRSREEPGTTTIHLSPGAILVLYTDGLIESTRDLEEGERRLRTALSDRSVRENPRLARAIFDSVLFDGSYDDVAILALRSTAGDAVE